MRRRYVVLFLFVFIDVLGFSLILPLLPYYARTFGATPTVIGFLISSNALTQLMTAPILGRLSDRYGRRPLLIVCIIGTAVSFLLLGAANSLLVLFISRLVDGLLGGNTSLAQAYVSDISEGKDRANAMGLIGAAFGLGFIFGPAMGGILSRGGNYALPAFVSAGLAIVNLISVLIWLPESLTPERRAALRDHPQHRTTVKSLMASFRRRYVGPLLTMRLFYGLAFTMFETVFSLYAIARLDLNAQSTSYVLAYVGVLVVLIQGGGIRLLTKRVSETALTFWGFVLMAISLLAWALAPSLWVLLIVLVPLSFASGVLNAVLSSLLSEVVPQEEVGGTLGLSSSLGSFARIISPSLGGWLIDVLGAWAPGVLGSAIVAGVTLYARPHLATIRDEAGISGDKPAP